MIELNSSSSQDSGSKAPPNRFSQEAHKGAGHQVTNRIKMMAKADPLQIEGLCKAKGRRVIELFLMADEFEIKVLEEMKTC